jgi:DNA repair exonuclease SbcCD nuclease subunit
VYPGNPQGRHVNEPGERGCVLVEVEEGRTRCRFVPVDRVRWHRLEVPLTGLGSLDGLVATVTEQVDASCEQELEGHAVRLTLTERGPLHRELSRPEALQQLEADLREQLSRRHPPVLLESLRDASRPELDLQTVRLSGGFTGTLLAEADALAADSKELEEVWTEDAELRSLRQRLLRLGVDALERPRPEWVEKAGLRVVEQLHEEDET